MAAAENEPLAECSIVILIQFCSFLSFAWHFFPLSLLPLCTALFRDKALTAIWFQREDQGGGRFWGLKSWCLKSTNAFWSSRLINRVCCVHIFQNRMWCWLNYFCINDVSNDKVPLAVRKKQRFTIWLCRSPQLYRALPWKDMGHGYKASHRWAEGGYLPAVACGCVPASLCAYLVVPSDNAVN